jgi:hypothetical protein
MTKTIGIINKYYPPYFSATGTQANQLAEYLKENEFNIVVFTQRGDYASRATSRDLPAGDLVYCKSFYHGKNRILRLISSFVESMILVNRAYRTRCDFTVVLTDPPFLNFWSSLFFKNQPWAAFCMDVYPDAFSAGGLISEKNPAFRLYAYVVKKNKPSFFISLGKNQSQFLRRKYFPTVPAIEVPVGLFNRGRQTSPTEEVATHKETRSKIVFGYSGNIGEAHDPQALVTFASLIDPSRHHFMISCYGKHAEFIQTSLKDKPGVTLCENLTDDDLSQIDIELVSLLPSWIDICIPSKALAAIERNHPVLFIGDEKSDTWQYLQSCGWRVQDTNQVKVFLKKLTQDQIKEKARFCVQRTADLKMEKERAFRRIQQEIEKVVNE